MRTYLKRYGRLPASGWRASSSTLKFGKLRNLLMHFGPADVVPIGDTPMKFLFEVMEPLVQSFWQESIIPYAAEWDGVLLDGHLEDMLKQNEVEITPALRLALDEAGSSPGDLG